MALNLSSGFPIPVWIGLTEDALGKEIKGGFEMGEAIPLLKEVQETKLKIKTKAEATILKKLNDMYEDPEFGPVFFVRIAKFLRDHLRNYRLSRDNPQLYGHYFDCQKVSPGIIVHFNSVTRKNHILFLLNNDDGTRHKPVKLGISTVLKWHRNRKIKALKAQLKEEKELRELNTEANQAMLDYLDANRSANKFQTKFYIYMMKLTKELLRNKTKTRRNASKTVFYEKASERFILFCENIQSALKKHSEEFSSLNPRMFEEKDFLRLQIDHYKNLAQAVSSEEKKMEHFLADLGEV